MSKQPHADPDTAALRATVGPRLKLARKALGLTQEDAAELIGISSEFYARMERGNALPSVETLRKLANALRVSVDYLLGADGPVPIIDTVPRISNVTKNSRQVKFILDRVRDNPPLYRIVLALLKLCAKRERAARADAEADAEADVEADVEPDDDIDDEADE